MVELTPAWQHMCAWTVAGKSEGLHMRQCWALIGRALQWDHPSPAAAAQGIPGGRQWTGHVRAKTVAGSRLGAAWDWDPGHGPTSWA